MEIKKKVQYANFKAQNNEIRLPLSFFKLNLENIQKGDN